MEIIRVQVCGFFGLKHKVSSYTFNAFLTLGKIDPILCLIYYVFRDNVTIMNSQYQITCVCTILQYSEVCVSFALFSELCFSMYSTFAR